MSPSCPLPSPEKQRIPLKKHLFETAMIVLGIFCAAMGIKGFLLNSHFIDGGVTGVAMLLATTLKLPLAATLSVINLPFVVMAAININRRFALKSALAIMGLALVLSFVPFNDITTDKLLSAVFGGFFLGAGVGLVIRGGAVLDGTEVAALLISRDHSLIRVGDVILAVNIVIFTVAAFVLGIEPALYSVLTYLSASRMIDFLIHGIEEYTAVIIMSERCQDIRERIIHELKRGVTVYKAKGGLSNEKRDVIYCVVTRLEIGSVKQVAWDIDPSAFIITHLLADAEGGVIKQTVLQKHA
jgi:uncharacterized membrane-anchored protein YitT (DUF2179 family)